MHRLTNQRIVVPLMVLVGRESEGTANEDHEWDYSPPKGSDR